MIHYDIYEVLEGTYMYYNDLIVQELKKLEYIGKLCAFIKN